MAENTEEISKRVMKAFFAYLKKSLHRSAQEYIHNERLNRADFLEDVPQLELESILSRGESQLITREKGNYHLHVQNDYLAEILSELEEKDRDFLYVLYYENLSTVEAAEVYGVTQQAVSKKRNKLLRRPKNE